MFSIVQNLRDTIQRLRSPLPLPRVRGRRLVVYARQDSFGLTLPQGFFAEFHAVVGALHYAERHGACDVLVRFTDGLYLDPPHGPNWWAYFFEERMSVQPGPARPREVRCRGWHRYGPHFWNDSWADLAMPVNTAESPYPLGDVSALRECRRLVKTYIRPRPAIVEEVDAYLRDRASGEDFLLGVHFRGTDKSVDHPAQKPTFAAYEEQIERILAHYAPWRFKIFVATDQIECVEWATARYGQRAFFLDDTPLSRADEPNLGVHKDTRFPAYERAKGAVMTCLLLARCHHLLKNRSSLSDCALEMNESLPWTMLLGDRVAHCDLLDEKALSAATFGRTR
jgi:hypothetical protein